MRGKGGARYQVCWRPSRTRQCLQGRCDVHYNPSLFAPVDTLRSLRIACGLTQEAVARTIGVTASQVSKWEHPSGPVPQPHNLKRLARLYGVP